VPNISLASFAFLPRDRGNLWTFMVNDALTSNPQWHTFRPLNRKLRNLMRAVRYERF
jgi:hypothetical protein